MSKFILNIKKSQEFFEDLPFILKMPKNCISCPIANWAHCPITKECHSGLYRPDNCPLLEISN